jgi:hypothetical protein
MPVSGPRASSVEAEAHQSLLGASQVLPLQPLGLCRIAASHGGKHSLVLAQARLSSPRQNDDPTNDDVGLLVDAVEHLGDYHVACGFDDALP